MITVCALLALSLPGLHAQISNSEYKFRMQSTIMGDRYGDASNMDDAPKLTMDCLSANGFGQWTSSSLAGTGYSTSGTSHSSHYGSGNWYLLANGLYKPSAGYKPTDLTSHPGCIPPGVVQNNNIGAPTEVKVATNMEGATCYVWYNTATGLFEVREIAASNVDISLGFLSNPQPNVNMNVVTGIQSWTASTAGSDGHSHGLTTSTDDPDFRDRFDVCCDGTFLYIAWCSKLDNSTATSSTVWVTAIYLSTGIAYSSFYPKALTPGGYRAAIACDGINIPSQPHCDVAYITQPPPSGQIRHKSIEGAAITSNTVNSDYFKPNHCDLTSPVPYPKHVRPLVHGSTSLLYAIVDDGGDGVSALMFWNPITAVANYADGIQTPMTLPLPTDGATDQPASNGIVVHDAPITAFVDHYSDPYHCVYQIEAKFKYGISYATTPRKPLIIIRGADNGYCSSTNTRLVLNRTASNDLKGDPLSNINGTGSISDWYVAAVNQMGIHIHWVADSEGNNVHYYMRDTGRTFNGPIYENTLVTDICTVSTSSEENGATIQAGVEMTLWTDPNYGDWLTVTGAVKGLYQPRDLSYIDPRCGQLNFRGAYAKLLIGSSDPDTWLNPDNLSASLANMPHCFFNFETDLDQGIEDHGVWDYWGRVAERGNAGRMATPFTDGAVNTTTNKGSDGEGLISIQDALFYVYGSVWTPAVLNVHGASDFCTGPNGKFVVEPSVYSTDPAPGQIVVEYEPGCYPLTNGTANSDGTGHLLLFGMTVLNGVEGGYAGRMWTNIPADSHEEVMLVDRYTAFLQDLQFEAINFDFTNIDEAGTAELRFGHINRVGNNPTFANSTFHEGCGFSACQVHAINPNKDCFFTIDSCSFDKIRGKCIFIDNDQDATLTQYGHVQISASSFLQLASNVADVQADDYSPYGIYVKNFDANSHGAWVEGTFEYGIVTIGDNSFNFSNTWSSTLNSNASSDYATFGLASSAIGLENSTAIITGNDIEDAVYYAGIGILAPFESPPNTYSAICSNQIEHIHDNNSECDACDQFGILSNYLFHIVSLNTIADNDYAYKADVHDRPKFFGNTFTGNREACLQVNPQSRVDMTGGGSGAFNTLTIHPHFTVEAENVAAIFLSDGGTVLLSGGYNNISITPDYYSGGINRIIHAVPSIDLGNIDYNYWGNDIDPRRVTTLPCSTCNWSTHTGEVNSEATASPWLNYSLSHLASITETAIPEGSECPTEAGHFGAAMPKQFGKMLALSSDSTICDSLWIKLTQYEYHEQWQELYDSGKKFIEICHDNKWASSVFNDLQAALQPLAFYDSTLWGAHREWLKSVMYLNTTDPEYFCQCVEAIGGTYHSPSDTSTTLVWKEQNRGLSIAQWLLQNTMCDSVELKREYNGGRYSQRQTWLLDTTQVYDTTLPSMAELGLDTLLAKHFIIKPPQNVNHGPDILTIATASPNPTGNGTVLTFGMVQAAYVRVELFDVLGTVIRGPSSEVRRFEEYLGVGNHSVPLDMSSLPSGTYYARLSTAYGETRTVKIVKQ